jgi:hypothetical protein
MKRFSPEGERVGRCCGPLRGGPSGRSLGPLRDGGTLAFGLRFNSLLLAPPIAVPCAMC